MSINKTLIGRENVELFIATTPYHILLSSVFCQENDYLIFACDKPINNLVLSMIEKKFDNRYQIIRSLNYFKENPFRLLIFKKTLSKISNDFLNYMFSRVFVFNDVDPIVQFLLSNLKTREVVLFEEGIGLYRDTKKRHRYVFSLLGKLFFGKNFENIKRIGESSFVDEIQCFHPHRLSITQKQKKVKKIDKISFQELAFSLGIKQINVKNIFVGQPLVEDGVITLNEYLDLIANLSHKIKEKNEELVIKLHPRERTGKFDNNVLDNCLILDDFQTPIELLVNPSINPNIFTIYSSAVLSMSRINGVHCFSLLGLFNKHLVPDEISKMFEAEGIVDISDLNAVSDVL